VYSPNGWAALLTPNPATGPCLSGAEVVVHSVVAAASRLENEAVESEVGAGAGEVGVVDDAVGVVAAGGFRLVIPLPLRGRLDLGPVTTGCVRPCGPHFTRGCILGRLAGAGAGRLRRRQIAWAFRFLSASLRARLCLRRGLVRGAFGCFSVSVPVRFLTGAALFAARSVASAFRFLSASLRARLCLRRVRWLRRFDSCPLPYGRGSVCGAFGGLGVSVPVRFLTGAALFAARSVAWAFRFLSASLRARLCLRHGLVRGAFGYFSVSVPVRFLTGAALFAARLGSRRVRLLQRFRSCPLPYGRGSVCGAFGGLGVSVPVRFLTGAALFAARIVRVVMTLRVARDLALSPCLRRGL